MTVEPPATLVTGPGTNEFDRDGIIEEHVIVSVCCGLVIVDGERCVRNGRLRELEAIWKG